MLWITAVSSVVWMPFLYAALRATGLIKRPSHTFEVLFLLAAALLGVLWTQLPNCSDLTDDEFIGCQESGMVVGFGQLSVLLAMLLVGMGAVIDRLWNGAQ